MKAEYKDKKGVTHSVNITFPTKSYHYGDVKVNGQSIGTWAENFEGYWHSKIELNGKKKHLWTDRKCFVSKADIVSLVIKEIVTNLSN